MRPRLPTSGSRSSVDTATPKSTICSDTGATRACTESGLSPARWRATISERTLDSHAPSECGPGPMQFGIILPIQAAGVGLEQLLAELREEVAAADRAGFDAFFLPEFHSVRGPGGLISPMLLGAALAEGTSRIKVGQAVLAAPLHHPVRVAEDLTMLSWLTQGRTILGVGSAHMPPDFDLYGVHRPDRYRLLRELLDVVRAAWSGEPFLLHGYKGRVTPRPYADTDPEVWM